VEERLHRCDHTVPQVVKVDDVHRIAGRQRSGGKACSRDAQAWVRPQGTSR